MIPINESAMNPIAYSVGRSSRLFQMPTFIPDHVALFAPLIFRRPTHGTPSLWTASRSKTPRSTSSSDDRLPVSASSHLHLHPSGLSARDFRSSRPLSFPYTPLMLCKCTCFTILIDLTVEVKARANVLSSITCPGRVARRLSSRNEVERGRPQRRPLLSLPFHRSLSRA